MDFKKVINIILEYLIKASFSTWRFLKKITPKLLVHIYVLLVVIIILAPLFWMITATFYDRTRLLNIPILPNFKEFTLKKYIYLFTYKAKPSDSLPIFISSFINTLKIAIINTIGVVLISTLNGFAFSRFRFKGKKTVLLTMMLLQMFPSFMSMMAFFLIFRSIGWNASEAGLYGITLIYMTGSIPINIFIVRGYLRGVPKAIDEAAYVDGASKVQLFTKIILPLSVPIIGFVAVNAFMGPWLDYMLQSRLIYKDFQTIAVWLYSINDPLAPLVYDPIAFMAGAFIISIPIVAVNFAMQKYIVYGMTTGAEKG